MFSPALTHSVYNKRERTEKEKGEEKEGEEGGGEEEGDGVHQLLEVITGELHHHHIAGVGAASFPKFFFHL